MKKVAVIFSGILVFSVFFGLNQREPGASESLARDQKPTQAIGSLSLKIDQDFGKMPVYFIPNRGQTDKRVAYYVQGKDKIVYFTDAGVTFVLTKEKEESGGSINWSQGQSPRGADQRALMRLHSWDDREGVSEGPGKREESGERWVVKLDFVGANSDVHPESLEETGAKFSYFKGKPEEWKTGLPAYSGVIYRDLWPGIDLVYYGTVNRLKYEFIVHPGADPSLIRLAYRGAESVSVDESGRLQVATPMGGFSDDAPVAYQYVEGKRTDVKLAFRPDGEACSFGFELGEYDRTLRLILDPAILIYCGYIGGSGHDSCNGIAVDGAGCAYVTGASFSTEATFPVTVGPDLTYNDNGDAFVAKISPKYFGYYVFDSHDYDGDGSSDLALFRPSDGVWYIRGVDNEGWGRVNDIPVPGDYNGDGITDLAVWRPSNGVWYLRKIDDDQWGQVGDVPVPADYDGDGRTDLAVWRPSDGTWRIRYRAGGGKVKPWGIAGDFPVPDDYNGDGIAELAVWRPSTGQWLIKKIDIVAWGAAGDIPLVR